MRCPICEKQLIATETIRVDNHPCDGSRMTWKWFCPNHPGIFWNETGDLYVEDYKIRKDYTYINGLTGAIDSWARKSQVEIFKHDEDKRIKLPFRWILKLEAEYKSNEQGDILSRKWKIRWIHKSTYVLMTPWYFIKEVLEMLWVVYKYQALELPIEPWMGTYVFGFNIIQNHNWKYWLLKKIGEWLAPKAGLEVPQKGRNNENN